MKLLDTSNYTGPLTPELCSGAREAGFDGIMPQSIDPPAGYPPGVTRNQVQAGLDAGMYAYSYIWLWFGLSLDDIRRKVDLLSPFTGQLQRLVLDVEDTSGGMVGNLRAMPRVVPPLALDRFVRQPKPKARHLIERLGAAAGSVQAREDTVAAALEILAEYPTRLAVPAIYTGVRWYWPFYMGGTTRFAGNPLHDANYDGIEDPSVPEIAGGGWVARAIKQYRGTTNLPTPRGTIPQVDLNVLSPEEEALVTQARDQPAEFDQGWLDKKDAVVQAGGRLQTRADQLDAFADQKYASGVYVLSKARRQSLHDQAAGVRSEARVILT